MDSSSDIVANKLKYQRLGQKYILVKTLGKGSYGKVKLALHEETNTFYAVKLFIDKNEPVIDPKKTLEQNFKREVRSMMLGEGCPYIAQVKDVGRGYVFKKNSETLYTEYYFLVTEYLDGGELFNYVYIGGGLPEKIVKYYAHQILKGLEYIHSRGIAHRDIKPQNIVLDSNFTAKICDFGFAKKFFNPDKIIALTSKCGTSPFMAPEMFKGDKEPYDGKKADLYSYAVTLFALATNKFPFEKACDTDPLYSLILNGRQTDYWKIIMQILATEVTLSDQFIHFLSIMFAPNPETRLDYEDIWNHPWFKDFFLTEEESYQAGLILQERKQQSILYRAQEREQNKRLKYQNQNYTGQRQAFRGRDEEDKDQEQKVVKECQEYISKFNSLTEIIISCSPDDIMDALKHYFERRESKGYNYQIHPTKYEVRARMPYKKDGEVVNEVAVKIKVLRYDEYQYCIEFNKVEGETLYFLELFDKFKNKFIDDADI